MEFPDLAATEAFAADLARALQAPVVIGLVGDLGAGKTALVRALIQALAPATRVKSPTYTLIESYALADFQAHHMDLYRLRHPAELAELGLDELLSEDAVVLIEWPDKGGALTPDLDLQISLKHVDAAARAGVLEALTPRGQELLGRLPAR